MWHASDFVDSCGVVRSKLLKFRGPTVDNIIHIILSFNVGVLNHSTSQVQNSSKKEFCNFGCVVLFLFVLFFSFSFVCNCFYWQIYTYLLTYLLLWSFVNHKISPDFYFSGTVKGFVLSCKYFLHILSAQFSCWPNKIQIVSPFVVLSRDNIRIVVSPYVLS